MSCSSDAFDTVVSRSWRGSAEHSLIWAVSLALLLGCQSLVDRKQEAATPTPAMEKEFQSAKALLEKGAVAQGLERLEKFASAHPESTLADDALMNFAQYNDRAGEAQEALRAYTLITQLPVASNYEAEARLGAGRQQMKLNRAEEALRSADESAALASGPERSITRLEALELKSLALSALGRHLEALENLVRLADDAEAESVRLGNSAQRLRDRARVLAQEILDAKLSDSDVKSIADSSRYGFLRPSAKFRIGLVLADQRKLSAAKSMFEDVISLAPKSEIAERAQLLVTQIDARSRVDSRTIGAVLPLSGRNAGVGYRALRGLQLGLGAGLAGKAGSNFRIAIIDSEGNPDLARRAVERLVVEDNALAIVGGLLSRTATAEATKAQELGVPMLLMSQKSGITEIGEFVFRNALTSRQQTQTLVSYAMDQVGAKRFAILYPNDYYGVEFANSFWDEVLKRGGHVTAAQTYDPDETDFRSVIQRLVATYYMEDRADEYRARYRAFMDRNPKRSVRQGGPTYEEVLTPAVDFEFLFIPDTPKAAGQILPMLAYYDVDNMRVLGTNVWNNPQFVQRSQKAAEGAVFVDGLMSEDKSFVSSEFFRSFRDFYGADPGLIETQAYDTGALLRRLISDGATSRISLQEQLSTAQNINGSLGRFSIGAGREFSRPISILTVKGGKIQPLESASSKR
jgi:branched-chain amino acid transport system substrate-binding protein